MSKASIFLNLIESKQNKQIYYEVIDKLDKLAAKYDIWLTDVTVDDENVMDSAKEQGLKRDSEKYCNLLIWSSLNAALLRAEDLPANIKMKVINQIEKIEAGTKQKYGTQIKKNIELENSFEKTD